MHRGKQPTDGDVIDCNGVRTRIADVERRVIVGDDAPHWMLAHQITAADLIGLRRDLRERPIVSIADKYFAAVRL